MTEDEYIIIRRKDGNIQGEELATYTRTQFEHILLQARMFMEEDKDVCPTCRNNLYSVNKLIGILEQDGRKEHEEEVVKFWQGERRV